MPFNHKIISAGFGKQISADNLFCDLKPQALKSLVRIKRIVSFRKGDVVFAKGDASSGIYVLLRGQAQMSVNGESGKRQIKFLVDPNNILGLQETLTDLPYRVMVESLSPCVFEFIRREDFICFLREEKEVCFRLVQLLGSSLQNKTQLARYSII